MIPSGYFHRPRQFIAWTRKTCIMLKVQQRCYVPFIVSAWLKRNVLHIQRWTTFECSGSVSDGVTTDIYDRSYELEELLETYKNKKFNPQTVSASKKNHLVTGGFCLRSFSYSIA